MKLLKIIFQFKSKWATEEWADVQPCSTYSYTFRILEMNLCRSKTLEKMLSTNENGTASQLDGDCIPSIA